MISTHHGGLYDSHKWYTPGVVSYHPPFSGSQRVTVSTETQTTPIDSALKRMTSHSALASPNPPGTLEITPERRHTKSHAIFHCPLTQGSRRKHLRGLHSFAHIFNSRIYTARLVDSSRSPTVPSSVRFQSSGPTHHE